MRSVILSAGRSCFVACPGCYNHFAESVIETSAVLRFMRRLHDQFGLTKVTVGGGDPLTRPDLLRLLRGLKELGLAITLDTVGTAFLRDAEIRFMGRGTAKNVPAADVVAVVDLIGIPLDGSTPAMMHQFRRHSSLADQISVLDLMDTLDAHICINTVVHAGNAGDVPRIAELIAVHPSVRQWQLFQFMPIGPLGYRNRHRYLISERAFHDTIAAIDRRRLPHTQVMAKSAGGRKHRYLLIDTAGVLWMPQQSTATEWSVEDENGRRSIVGRLDDPHVYRRLAALEQPNKASSVR